MYLGFFRGRANICGQRAERKKRKKKKGTKKKERPRQPRGARKVPRYITVDYPAKNNAVVVRKYRLACGNRACGFTEIAETQKPFCSQCSSNMLTVTDVFELPEAEDQRPD